MVKKINSQTKVDICKILNLRTMRDKEICEKFKISKGMLYRIKLEKNVILGKEIDGVKGIKETDLNELIYSAFCNLREENIPINGPILKTIALKIANEIKKDDFRASNGWMEKFLNKYGIVFKTLSGEAKTANMQDATEFCSGIDNLKNKYGAGNVFNCDETALFYKKMSSKSFVNADDSAKGIKQCKNKLTLLLCCSYTGEKFSPLIIGSSKSPRCLKNLDLSLLKIEYDCSRKSWMTKSIFESWLDRKNNTMIEKNRKIALILDNATCHNTSKIFSNIDLIFLPKNTTSLIQPCDQGIIKAFKDKFNNLMTANIIYEVNNNKKNLNNVLTKINLLDAICTASLAWDDVSEQTIHNCFKNAFSFQKSTVNPTLEETKLPIKKVEIDDIVTNVIPDITEEEISEEEENSIENLGDVAKWFGGIIQFTKEFCPENLTEFYACKTKILKSYRKNTKKECSLLDFFTKI